MSRVEAKLISRSARRSEIQTNPPAYIIKGGQTQPVLTLDVWKRHFRTPQSQNGMFWESQYLGDLHFIIDVSGIKIDRVYSNQIPSSTQILLDEKLSFTPSSFALIKSTIENVTKIEDWENVKKIIIYLKEEMSAASVFGNDLSKLSSTVKKLDEMETRCAAMSSKLDHHESYILSLERELDLLGKTACNEIEIHQRTKESQEETIRFLEVFKKETSERIATLTEDVATMQAEKQDINAMLLATLAENEILKTTTRTLNEDIATMRADMAYFRENVLEILNSKN